MKNAVFSVIFYNNLKYFDDFLNSLNNQICKNYELFLVNDGIEAGQLNSLLKNLKSSYYLYSIEKGLHPSKIREKGIEELLKRKYDKIVFADSDDMMSSNRINESLEALEEYAIVFNDITIIDEVGNIIKSKIWGNRLYNKIVDQNFLIDKNVLGLGNTAIRSSFLKKISIPNNIIAVDWFLFSMLIGNEIAKFIENSYTLYRQHSNNTIGIKEETTIERLEYILDVREKHFKEMEKYNSQFTNKVEMTLSLRLRIQNRSVSFNTINKEHFNYFWWEEPNYIINERDSIIKN